MNTITVDWTSVLNTLIANIPLIIAAVAGLLKIFQIEKNTNSMKDALVAATRSDALREGVARGVAQEQGKQGLKDDAHAAGIAEAVTQAASITAAVDAAKKSS